MKRFALAVVVAVMILAASVAQAAGLNQEGQSGGYLVPNAQISNRLSVNAAYVDLNSNSANQVGVTAGVLKHLEAGYTRADNNVNTFHAKLGFSFLKKTLDTSFAVGAIGRTVEGVRALDTFDAYLAGEIVLKDLKNTDLTLVLRGTDASGQTEYLGEASVGVEVLKGWSVYGEFAQKVNAANNQMSLFVQRDLGTAVVKAGVADLGNGVDDQFFLSASISGI